MLFSKKIVLDTNFLLIPGQFKVDIFEELQRVVDFKYKLYIFDKTLNELENILKNANQRDKIAAKIAKSLIMSKNITLLKGEQTLNVDDLIVDYAANNKIIVCTQDAHLKKRLQNLGTSIITLKGKKHVSFV